MWTSVLDSVSANEAGDQGFQYASQFGGVDFTSATFGADVWNREDDGTWSFFDSSSGDGNPPTFPGLFFANDGNSWFGASDAAFEDLTPIVTAPDTRYLFATPGAENGSGIGGLYQGDVDHDGDLDADDIDTLYANLGSFRSDFDIDMDFGAASQSDVDALVRNTLLQSDLTPNANFSFLTDYGDTDLDRDVDPVDLDNFAPAFLAGSMGGWATGDFTGDMMVDSLDLDLFAAAFLGGGNAPSTSLQSVPEPSALGLAVLAITALGCIGWQKRSKFCNC